MAGLTHYNPGRQPGHGQGTTAVYAYLELLLGQLKVEGIKVALNVGHACCLGDDTGAVLDGPSDKDLQVTDVESALSICIACGLGKGLC